MNSLNNSSKNETAFIAHVQKNGDKTWAPPHLLINHLDETAKLAEDFAAKFQSGEWGKASGLAHDAGKGRILWQGYIRHKSGFDEEANLEGKVGKMPHAIYGANLVEELFGKVIGRFLAYCIAGHHTGLPDWDSAQDAGQASLQFQEAQTKEINDIAADVVNKIQRAKPGSPPWKFASGLDPSLWIRMLYSCLVDADFLDTESYMSPEQSGIRGNYCSLAELLDRFNQFIKQLDEASEDTKVNEIRRDVRTKCIQMAKEPQGIFSLSVPTGGGKTLSSLAFGLEHAKKHDHLDRIIYVIPYTSIIEQNADVFRSSLGPDQVIEHHSAIDENDSTSKSRLASENWDAPVIVTTSVQFFESLFAAKSSRCRKLHNIANSVVILDEAQLVPVEYLAPILETLQLLVNHYHVTLMISTATQPAFEEHLAVDKLFKGLKNVREVMGDDEAVSKLNDSLKRTNVQIPRDLDNELSWEKLANELKQYDQVLCVVSDRKSCRELHSLMPKGTFHLSGMMCGQHRSEVISCIKQKLLSKESVRVISTQLVEAGVDVDFPVVYRAMAGLDSIAQAAGRCNREGKLEDHLGKVVVFVAPKKPPKGILRKAMDITHNILSTVSGDPLEYSLVEKYFSELYWKANSLDSKEIISLLSPDQSECSIYFRAAAAKFHIVDDSLQKTILVRYGEGEDLINLLSIKGPDRQLMRKLQRYTVNIYNYTYDQMLERGSVDYIYPGILALKSNLDYSKDIGLLVDETSYDSDAFIQ